MAYEQHIRAASGIAVNVAVVTLSDTRNEETDLSGKRICELLVAAGHVVSHYSIIKDEPGELERLMNALLGRSGIDAVLSSGGTGVSRRDHTIDVMEEIIEQPLDGFGELFRMLSWEQIGSGAMLSRAIGGIARGKVIFCMPGSLGAVELAMEKLVLPELGHVVGELRK